jgi:hypothetical protein
MEELRAYSENRPVLQFELQKDSLAGVSIVSLSFSLFLSSQNLAVPAEFLDRLSRSDGKRVDHLTASPMKFLLSFIRSSNFGAANFVICYFTF